MHQGMSAIKTLTAVCRICSRAGNTFNNTSAALPTHYKVVKTVKMIYLVTHTVVLNIVSYVTDSVMSTSKLCTAVLPTIIGILCTRTERKNLFGAKFSVFLSSRRRRP